jgi:hypothetical protein
VVRAPAEGNIHGRDFQADGQHGGVQQNIFYNDYRVLERDPFFVDVVN